MRDFKDFNGGSENNGTGTEFVREIMEKFNGKTPNELYGAIIEEAKKRKKAGTLTNAEIDAFYRTLAPFLDDGKKKTLIRIIEKLKNI